MKSPGTSLTLLLILAATASFAQTDAQKGFATIKSLAGSWEGKASNGETVKENYRITSNGSAVMSEIIGHDDMITMFHLDGDRLLMTHYCGAGNQPRMKASASPDGKTITFDFIDATNLASPQDGHMHHVVYIIDGDRLLEDWYFLKDGKDIHEHFDLQRKKPV
jgi:hypothetical protein